MVNGGYYMIIIENIKYYTASELALQCNVSMETIRRWRKKKGLKSHLIGVRKHMYSEEQLKNFINNEI